LNSQFKNDDFEIFDGVDYKDRNVSRNKQGIVSKKEIKQRNVGSSDDYGGLLSNLIELN